MRKKVLTAVLSAMILAFAGSAVITVASAAKPGCNRCQKDGCPAGHCYVDCVGCCFNDPQRGILCYR